jgi:hypothetical protein
VPVALKNGIAALTEIFVELQFHVPTGSRGMET